MWRSGGTWTAGTSPGTGKPGMCGSGRSGGSGAHRTRATGACGGREGGCALRGVSDPMVESDPTAVSGRMGASGWGWHDSTVKG